MKTKNRTSNFAKLRPETVERYRMEAQAHARDRVVPYCERELAEAIADRETPDFIEYLRQRVERAKARSQR